MRNGLEQSSKFLQEIKQSVATTKTNLGKNKNV